MRSMGTLVVGLTLVLAAAFFGYWAGLQDVERTRDCVSGTYPGAGFETRVCNSADLRNLALYAKADGYGSGWERGRAGEDYDVYEAIEGEE